MRLVVVIILFAACLLVNGQAANQVFLTDSVKGNENVYLTGAKESSIYQGIVGFTFETSHDAATFYLQGCYDTDSWYNIDTISASGASLVKNIMYEAPPRFKYYRLYGDGNVGDTCIITNARHFLKY